MSREEEIRKRWSNSVVRDCSMSSARRLVEERIANAPTDIQYLLDRNAFLGEALGQVVMMTGMELHDTMILHGFGEGRSAESADKTPDVAQYLKEKQS